MSTGDKKTYLLNVGVFHNLVSGQLNGFLLNYPLGVSKQLTTPNPTNILREALCTMVYTNSKWVQHVQYQFEQFVIAEFVKLGFEQSYAELFFYNEQFGNEILPTLRETIGRVLPMPEWAVWDIKIQGHQVTMVMVGDYRVLEWHRINEGINY